MAELSKLERAKEQTRGKFRGILKDLSNLSTDDFYDRIGDVETCGFCSEYGNKGCSECPFVMPCRTMAVSLVDVYVERQWRKLAGEICRTVLEEVDKV